MSFGEDEERLKFMFFSIAFIAVAALAYFGVLGLCR